MMSHSKHEKGLPLPASAVHITPSITGRTKRRRIVLVVGIMFVATLVLHYYDGGKYGRALFATLKKDAWRDDTSKSANNIVASSEQTTHKQTEQSEKAVTTNGEPKQVVQDDRFTPTDALRKLAHTIGMDLPDANAAAVLSTQASKVHSATTNALPSQTDRVLLLLSAMKHKAFRVPTDLAQRTHELLPDTFEHVASVLRTLSRMSDRYDTKGDDDASLYLSAHDQWIVKHQKLSPLTVFSKSYCPYSRRAKALLTQMGAKFDVYEVDLRDDAAALQEGLRELSGHKTFPAIFVQDKLIGGSDDLVKLDSMGVLHGVLEAAGVQFT